MFSFHMDGNPPEIFSADKGVGRARAQGVNLYLILEYDAAAAFLQKEGGGLCRYVFFPDTILIIEHRYCILNSKRIY